jgi:anti-anti-sigma factor
LLFRNPEVSRLLCPRRKSPERVIERFARTVYFLATAAALEATGQQDLPTGGVRVAIVDLRGEVHGEPTGGIVLELEGELDIASEPLLTSWVASLPGEPEYVIDLRGVTFVDSHGLAALIAADRMAKEWGATLVVRSPGRQARSLLEVTGLDAHLTIA